MAASARHGGDVNALLEEPAYTIPEAASYIDVPTATLRYWIEGARPRRRKGRLASSGLIALAAPGRLSFKNLVEAFVLSALRRDHRISFPRIHAALEFVAEHFRWDRPLLEERFLTDGVDLFVERLGVIVNVSRAGQLPIADVLRAYLTRVERNPKGIPIRLYPYTRPSGVEPPRAVVIDPAIQFGRPVLAGSGVPVEVVAERFKAGDSIESLADDYGQSPADIQEALRAVVHLDSAA